MRITEWTLRRAAVACLIALAACAKSGGDDPGGEGLATDTAAALPAPAAAPADTAAAAANGAPTDADIFAILSASNQAEIAPSRLAEPKVQNARLKRFAPWMVNNHTALADSGSAVAQRIGVTPTENTKSREIQAQTQRTMQRLQGLSGMSFDTAYAGVMLVSHQQTLAALDTAIIPSARNPELRTLLERTVRPMVQVHLDSIRQIVSSMGGGTR
ncbi:MAG TPA: DUF4142 domain-containing protein [Longimicrobium sp.]|nr:DUF4142 domain-containing protein [Longimicrobium sp.]